MYKEAGKPGFRVMRARKGQRVTQPFSSGVVRLYSVTDGGEPGERPREVLTEKVKLCYEEQHLGLQRYYSGRQNQVKIERVIRAPRRGDISSQDMASTEDGTLYRIDLVQPVLDVYPPSMDLTLCRMEQDFSGEEDDGLAREDSQSPSGGDQSRQS